MNCPEFELLLPRLAASDVPSTRSGDKSGAASVRAQDSETGGIPDGFPCDAPGAGIADIKADFPGVLAEALRHSATCARCGRLLAVSRGEVDTLDDAEAEAAVRGILHRTSGEACTAAEVNLPAWADGLLPDGDADLLSGHLAHCTSCRALAEALVFMRNELPVLAEADPGPAFTGSVLALTSRSVVAVGRPGLVADIRELSVAWRRRWAAMIRRPRAAMELAYGASLIFCLVVGSPATRVREVSLGVTALASRASSPGLVAASAAPEKWWEGAGGSLRGLADKAEKQAPAGFIARLSKVWKLTAAKATALRDHGPVMGRAILRLDMVGVWREAEFIRQAGTNRTEPAAPGVRPVNDRGMATPGGSGDGPAASKGGTS